jgi:transposase
MLYVAIDQHSKQLTVNIRNEAGDVALRRQVSTKWSQVRAFFTDVRRRADGEGGFVAILEVCGFNDWLLKLLEEYGCQKTFLVQPESRGNAKTDRRDADALGELLWVNRHRLLAGKKVRSVRQVTIPSAEDREGRQLTEMRRRLGQLRTRTLNAIQHLLAKHNLRQACPTKGIQTKRARQWLAELELPRMDRMELDLLLGRWKVDDEQIRQVEEEIQVRQRRNETAHIIATVPGVGAYGSLALACRIGSIDRFPTPGSLANYFGLTPRSNNSGDARQRLGSITKQGSATVRFLLGQLTPHVVRKDPWLRQWRRQIKRRRGGNVANVAVMRRLTATIWHMLKDRQPYCPGGPAAVARQRQLFAAVA